MDLFSREPDSQPLAARMRPETLDDLVGQEEILGPGRLLRRAIKSDQLSSLIFYGPPGTGKTTLARIIANNTKSHFISLNAVLSGIKQAKEAIEKAQELQKFQGKKTLLFVDEVHRWNKAQQDALLPWVENGTIILIGATTENPFFEVNSALVSRSRIFQLKPLTDENLMEIARRTLIHREKGYGQWRITFDEGALEHLVKISDGDARTLLNAIQLAVETTPERFPPPPETTIHITRETAEESIQKRAVLYDRDGDYHFDTISAFIKSLRGSDPDAALYWLAVMVRAGEDPAFLFRRMLISASEDIGMADPQALLVVSAASQAFERTGFPEGNFFLTQAALYLATAPKSNSALGFFDAMKAVEQEGGTPVPLHLKDANRDGPLGHGAGYQYPHSFRNHWVNQQYLPSALRERIFYHPGTEGIEAVIREQVLLRRECQLSAALTDADEEHTFGPENRERERWARRTESGLSRFLLETREKLFSATKIKRNSRVLVLEETSGLLVLEACRRVPEGGVFYTLKKGYPVEILESLLKGWPEAEKPLRLAWDREEAMGPTLLEEGIKPDLVTGILSSPIPLDQLVFLLEQTFPTGTRFSFLLPQPGNGTRPGNLLSEGSLSSELRELYLRWEKRAYETLRTTSSIQPDGHQKKIQAEIQALTETERTEEIPMTKERLLRWFPDNPEDSPFWKDLKPGETTLYQELKTIFHHQLTGKKVPWIKKFSLIHGIMDSK